MNLNPSRLRALQFLTKKGPMPEDAIVRNKFNRRTFDSLEGLGLARFLRTRREYKATRAGENAAPK